MGEVSMRIQSFTIAALSAPVPDRLSSCNLLPVPDKNQSLSGNISSVGDAEFSVDVQKNRDVNTVQFPVDDHTKAEAKLPVGAHATLHYRSTGDNNIPVRVV